VNNDEETQGWSDEETRPGKVVASTEDEVWKLMELHAVVGAYEKANGAAGLLIWISAAIHRENMCQTHSDLLLVDPLVQDIR